MPVICFWGGITALRRDSQADQKRRRCHRPGEIRTGFVNNPPSPACLRLRTRATTSGAAAGAHGGHHRADRRASGRSRRAARCRPGRDAARRRPGPCPGGRRHRASRGASDRSCTADARRPAAPARPDRRQRRGSHPGPMQRTLPVARTLPEPTLAMDRRMTRQEGSQAMAPRRRRRSSSLCGRDNPSSLGIGAQARRPAATGPQPEPCQPA